MILNETRKEDDLYFSGPFWIKSDSLTSILKGRFELMPLKLLTDYDGNYINYSGSKNELTHKHLWLRYGDSHSYTYYPRGRVGIYKGVAYINITEKCNIPSVVNAIIKEYSLHGLEIDVQIDDNNHYDFELE